MSYKEEVDIDGKILQLLDAHLLNLEDLKNSIDTDPRRTQFAIESLFIDGLIDKVGAGFCRFIAPVLYRKARSQEKIVDADYLTLTSFGYFKLHPFIERRY